MYVVGISNVFGLEAWNSYSNPYPRNLQLVVSAKMTAVMTNELGGMVLGSTNLIGTNMNMANWRGWANASAVQNSFVLPWGGGRLMMFLTNSTYMDQPPRFAPQTHIFTQAEYDQFYVPHWWLNPNARVQFILVDTAANRIVDYVNLNNWEPTLDINAKLAEGADCTGNPSGYSNPANQWCTNRLHNSINPRVPTIGVINQIGIGLGLNGTTLPDINSFTRDPYSGLDSESAIDGFRYNLLGLSAIFAKDQGKVFYKSNLFYAPFDPYHPLYIHTSWQANDPLVHYTIGDLIDLSLDESNRVDSVSHNPALDNIGVINKRYQPWGGNTYASDHTLDFQVAVKDPNVTRSDAWDFPTNKFPNVGWLGRVHRGTPWQTVFLKSTNILQTMGRTVPLMAQSLDLWKKWTGNPVRIPNIGLIPNFPTNFNLFPNQNGFVSDALFSMPTNDWRILDLFTTAFNDNAARGQLSVNQSGLAAWSAVLSGVGVLSNSAPNSYTVIEPAGVYNPAQPSPLAKIVNGINNTRTNFPNNAFQHLGDVLATPELTLGSPYLSTTNSSLITDEVVERIPQQILGLLRGGEQPRFVIYSYGQTLKPADRSSLQSGQFSGMITNYQITGETATRTVIRIEGAPNNPRAVIESFNVLPPD